MQNIKKYFMTLALLLTAATGAWAEESKVYTSAVATTDLKVGDILAEGFSLTTTNPLGAAFTLEGGRVKRNGEIRTTGYGIELNIITAYGANASIQTSDGTYTPVDENGNDGNAWLVTSVGTHTGMDFVKLAGITIESPLTVAWDAATKTGTFKMPGSDVVLTPQYAPAAQLAENGAPAAVSGLEIAADADIITAGQSAQGTLLYAVTTSAEAAPALTAFSATLPNAKDLTAAGTYYVWYYIQGHDTPEGQEPSAENTFNDSEIMGPLTVELLTNEHTLNIKQSPNITVTVAGTAVTPTDDKVTPVTTGQEVKIKANEGYKFRKVEVKKAEAKLPKYADVVKICDIDADGKYLISSFFDGTNANFTTITKEEAIALAEYLGGGDIRVVYEEYEFYGDRYVRSTNAAGKDSGGTLSTANFSTVPLYYVPAGN